MDKNSIIGLVLIFAIVLGYTWWKAPSAEELQRAQQYQDSVAQVEMAQLEQEAEAQLENNTTAVEEQATTPVAQLDSAGQALQDSLNRIQAASKFGIFLGSSTGTAEELRLENEKLELVLTTKGAAPSKIRLKDFKQYSADGNGSDVLLFDPDSNDFSYRFTADGRLISSADLYFEVVDQSSKKAVLRANAGSGQYVELVYELQDDSYLVNHDIRIVGLENQINPGNLSLNWNLSGMKNEKHLPTERQMCTVFYRYMNEDRDFLSETDEEFEKLEGKSNWVAFKQKFFTLAMISETGFSGNGSEIAIVPSTDTLHTKNYSTKLYFDERPSSSVNIPLRFYFGPNHYQTLEATEIPEFDRLIDLGWGIFGTMNRWLVIPLFNWLSGFGWGYGIIILVLTLIIKAILFPITWKNYMSSAKMRVLKPQIDVLTEKFKDKDPVKKQQATMDLYRKTGVNPMAGCLPALLQMPILYAMFRFFPSSIELRQQSFLWAEDLSSYDSVMDLPFSIPAYGAHVSLFTLLMAASTMIYTRMNSSQMPTQAGMPNMKLIMTLFPIMMLFIFNSFSSGLSYYYLLANIISIGQMFIIKKFLIDEDKIKLQIEQNKKKPKKKSRWMQKMEEVQKQQEAQRKGRRK